VLPVFFIKVASISAKMREKIVAAANQHGNLKLTGTAAS
jgi:hypothetical protein